MTQQTPIITFDVTVTSTATPDAVYDILADPSTHLVWAGEQAPDQKFRLLTLKSPKGGATVGTVFTSTGANSKDGSSTFHDRSTVLEATPPKAFAFETEAQLERKRRPIWEVRFVHRYAIERDGDGSRITYTADVHPQNYRPYWLHPLMRPVFKVVVQTAVAKHMTNLARLAEAGSRVRKERAKSS